MSDQNLALEGSEESVRVALAACTLECLRNNESGIKNHIAELNSAGIFKIALARPSYFSAQDFYDAWSSDLINNRTRAEFMLVTGRKKKYTAFDLLSDDLFLHVAKKISETGRLSRFFYPKDRAPRISLFYRNCEVIAQTVMFGRNDDDMCRLLSIREGLAGITVLNFITKNLVLKDLLEYAKAVSATKTAAVISHELKRRELVRKIKSRQAARKK
jgi:hypothetical protein